MGNSCSFFRIILISFAPNEMKLVCSFLGSLSFIFYKDLIIEQENRVKIELYYGHINRSAGTGFLIRNAYTGE